MIVRRKLSDEHKNVALCLSAGVVRSHYEVFAGFLGSPSLKSATPSYPELPRDASIVTYSEASNKLISVLRDLMVYSQKILRSSIAHT